MKITELINEAANPAQQAAIAISKKEKGQKPKNEGTVLEFGGGGYPATPKYKVGDMVMVKGYQGTGQIAYIKHRGDVGVRFKEPTYLRVVTTIDDLIPKQGMAEDWQKVNKKDKTDGMSRKAVKAYRRENPGSKLKTAVTTKPSKLKKGSKSAKRRKSFCARMSGMKKAHASAKTKRDPNSPINKALRRWNCESVEQLQELVMIAEQYIASRKKILK